MLWYKIWRETRVRTAIGAMTVAWICVIIILFQGNSRHAQSQAMTYVSYVWNAVYKDYVRNLFIILTIVLGGGSLVQERAHGTAGFTLALPASRSRLLRVRASVGLSEMALLAFVPAILIPVLSRVAGEHYPVDQAWKFGILWACGGTLTFTVAQLLSTLVANEYVAWVASFLLIMFYEAALRVTTLDRFPAFDLFRIMSGDGMSYFSATEHVFVGPLPWVSLTALIGISALGLLAADRVLRRRDF